MSNPVAEKILLVIDHGMSGTRAIWNKPGGPVNFLSIGPEIREVNSRNILESGLSSGKPEDRILIEIEETLFAVGKKARDLRGKTPVEETKYQMASYKTVAVVGAIAEYLGVSNLEVTISTLLPFSEYQDRRSFSEMVKRQLKEFKFQEKEISCKVREIKVKPEGAGIAIAHMNECEDFESQNTLILMVGHRDASCLPFELGASPEGTTSLGDQIGFLEFQQQVVRRAALNLRPENQAKLPEYLFKSKAQPEYTERIARMAVSRDVAKKTADIEAAIRDSQLWYVETLTHWIKTTLGDFLYEIDQIVISGGTALYFQEDLTEFFHGQSQRTPQIKWSGLSHKEDLEDFLGMNLSPEMAVRLADVYGLYQDAVAKQPELQPNSSDSDRFISLENESTEDLETKSEKGAAGNNGHKRQTEKKPALPKINKA